MSDEAWLLAHDILPSSHFAACFFVLHAGSSSHGLEAHPHYDYPISRSFVCSFVAEASRLYKPLWGFIRALQHCIGGC